MKTTRSRTVTIGLIALIAGVAVPAFAQAPRPQPGVRPQPTGAKALFYGSSGATHQSNAPAAGMSMGQPVPPTSTLGSGFPTTPGMPAMAGGQQDYMGLSYWVELVEPNGQLRRVTVNHAFRSGDRIRLNVQSNRDGYLTILNVGSTGRVTTIFPQSPDAASTPIRANQVYQIPPGSFLRFDNNPGEEQLLALLSPTPLGGTTIAANPVGGGMPGGTFPGAPSGTIPSGGMPPSLPPLPGGPGTTVAGGMPTAPPSSLPPPPGGLPPLPPLPGSDPAAGSGSPGGVAGLPPAPPSGTSTLPPLPPFPTGGDTPPAPGTPGPMTGAGAPAAGGAEGAKSALVQRAMQRGAKDLTIEVDGASPQPASYAVAPVSSLRDGGMISLQIKLRHY